MVTVAFRALGPADTNVTTESADSHVVDLVSELTSKLYEMDDLRRRDALQMETIVFELQQQITLLEARVTELE